MPAIQQRRAPSAPPRGRPVAGTPSLGAGHHQHVESLVRGFEVLTQRINDLDEVPLDLFERFARALNGAERAALARVQLLEQEEH